MIPKVHLYRNSSRAYKSWRECVDDVKNGKKEKGDCELLYTNYRKSVNEIASLIALIVKTMPYDPSQEGIPPKNHD